MASPGLLAEIRLGSSDDLDDFVEIIEEVGSWLWRRGIHQLAPGSNRAQRVLLERHVESGCLIAARREGATRMRLDCWDGNAALRSYYCSAGYSELDAVESHGYLVRLFEKRLSPVPPAT